MISIKRFLNRSDDEAVLWQVICLLLEKIGTQAVRGDRSDYETFARSIEEIRESVSGSNNPENLLVTAGSAIQAMTDYNHRVTRFIRRQGSEIQNIVSMLAETVNKMSGGDTRFARQFQDISDSLEKVVTLGDLTDVKVRLRDSLRVFQDEAMQKQREMEGAIAALQQQIDRSRAIGPHPHEIDPATGLPQQDQAEEAMQHSLKSGTRTYVVTVVISRMQSINARFGYRIGDEVLRVCRNTIDGLLSPGDQMFRWTGPALVLLIERNDPLEVVRAQLKRILDSKVEESFDLGTRSVLIPISTVWSAFKLVSPVSVAVKQIQTFIASQSPRDFA